MSDTPTPLTEETWLSCDFSTHIGAINAGNALVKRARQLERALDAAKEQVTQEYCLLEEANATIVSLRAQLSDTRAELERRTQTEANITAIANRQHDQLSAQQSATNRSPRIYTKCPACHNDTLTINNDKHLLCTWIDCPNPTLIDRLGEATPQDHARVIEELSDKCKRELDYSKPCLAIQIIARHMRTLADKLLKPQPRKEGEEPCATSKTVVDAVKDTQIQAASSTIPVASNAAHTSDPSGAATCTCDPGWWHESCPVHSIKLTGAAPTQDHLAPGGGPCTNHYSDGSKIFPNRECSCVPATPRETTNGKLDVSEAAKKVFATVYGGEDIYSKQRHIESILTRLTGDQAKRIAELEAECERFESRINWIASNRPSVVLSNHVFYVAWIDGDEVERQVEAEYFNDAIDAAMQPSAQAEVKG